MLNATECLRMLSSLVICLTPLGYILAKLHFNFPVYPTDALFAWVLGFLGGIALTLKYCFIILKSKRRQDEAD